MRPLQGCNIASRPRLSQQIGAPARHQPSLASRPRRIGPTSTSAAAAAASGGGGGGGGRAPLRTLLATLLSPSTPRVPLSTSGKACALTALYILPAGLIAVAFPSEILGALYHRPALPSKTSIVMHSAWIPRLLRFVGMLAATFGVYYAGAALGETVPGVGAGVGFKVATAVGRLLLAFGLAALGATTGGRTGTALVVFAVLNTAGGLSMAWALGKE